MNTNINYQRVYSFMLCTVCSGFKWFIFQCKFIHVSYVGWKLWFVAWKSSSNRVSAGKAGLGIQPDVIIQLHKDMTEWNKCEHCAFKSETQHCLELFELDESLHFIAKPLFIIFFVRYFCFDVHICLYCMVVKVYALQ